MPRKSSKAIIKRVILNLPDKSVVIAHFRDKNEVLFYLLLSIYIFIGPESDHWEYLSLTN